MLIALLTMMLLGGNPVGLLTNILEAQDEVKAVMSKSGARSEALAILKDGEKRAKAHNKVVKDAQNRLEKALEDHTTSTDEIDTLWSKYHASNRNLNIEIVELRFALKEHIGREDWGKIFASDTR